MEIAYTRTGSGAPLVLLHAFPMSSAMWDAQRGGLSRDCEVITLDQRGFGESAGGLGEDAPDLGRVVDDLAGLLDRLDLRQVVLGGLSMGGYVAMAFLRRHPERVRGLVLANTKASADTPEAAENRLRIADAVEQARSCEPLLSTVFPKLLGESSRAGSPALTQTVERMVRHAPWQAVAWTQRAMAARGESFDVLAGAQAPVLVIAGDEDALMSEADAEALVKAAPDSELVTLPGVGHLSAMEAPREFNEAVSSLLRRV
ncbi:MAG: alpha/beta fold hydrolase [Micromonosporaceae bacterium]|nr:alpha/beta fold hydrolase [Micromonosporaceae bacterium]